MNKDRMINWVANNYNELAVDFVQTIEELYNKDETARETADRWFDYCMARYVDAEADAADMIYERMKEEEVFEN